MTRALEGILAVALEQAVAAPLCSSRMADAGARVIKIERAEGDFARGYDRLVKGGSAYFVWLNRGKESLVLDIKQPDDAALLHRILARADVFIQNLLPGAARRAGFGSADLRGKHPRLITVDISGYGDEGPYAAMKAYDLLVQAETGLADVTGSPEAPGRVGVSVCDIAAGLYAYNAVLEALIKRGKTGVGSAIAVSLFDGMADWMTVPLLQYQYGGKAPKRMGMNHPTVSPYGIYRAGDGGGVVISIQNEREWARFRDQVMARPDLAGDPRFDDNPGRVANRPALDALLAAAFKPLTRDQLIDRLNKAQIAYGALNGVAELLRHPQLRRVPVETAHGMVDLVAPPARVAGEAALFGRVPEIGEDTEAIRREFAA
ncbi:MAG: CoA transferase [Alphaproteobacteria bacterium]|nr:CoA transferase [Alphaproteobacteria bacterium]